jgi:mono/diheme cytochrome c family protein
VAHVSKRKLAVLLAAATMLAAPVVAANMAASSMAGDITINTPASLAGDPVAQPVSTPTDPAAAAQIKRGEYLATAGDCQYCHSVPGGQPYAGGQAVQSPFGDLFTPNITPDKSYGIGNYTDAQFWNVMHNGIGPGHSLLVFPRYLYPVMPWQDYNKLSYPDVMAIKAYLMSLAPVAAPDRPTQMAFPFTLRAGLLLWRLAFFDTKPIQYDPSWSPSVRNGAFLVDALAHCSECHTQRNIAMAIEPSRYLAGGHLLAQSWYAPNISSSKTDGVGGWSQANLVSYLSNDGNLGPGGPFGPMKAVVDDSLSRLPHSDIVDIANFLQTGTPAKDSEITPPSGAAPQSDGATLYAENCARCHGAKGEGVAGNFPNLAGNAAITNAPADNLEAMILGGFQAWHAGEAFMPEFGQRLGDDQIAAIANYVRTTWGNYGKADATAAQVAGLRGLSSDWIALSTGTTQAVAAGTAFTEIDGKLELFGDRKNCMLNADFSGAGTHHVYLAGSCARGGAAFVGAWTIDGATYPADLILSEYGGHGAVDTVRLTGTLPAGGGPFQATMTLDPAND